MTALTIEYRAPDSLKPAPRNSRTHSEAQIEQLVAAISEFGFTNPILLDEAGQIIAGHGRLEAARRMGLAEVPTITLPGLSPEQARALVIADNKLALNAGWDFDALALEVGELQAGDFDISLLGFSDAEVADLLGKAETLGGMPELPDGDRSEFCQMTFVLHRSQAEEVERALASAKAMIAEEDVSEGDEARPNKNSNGNALALLAESFITHHGDADAE